MHVVVCLQIQEVKIPQTLHRIIIVTAKVGENPDPPPVVIDPVCHRVRRVMGCAYGIERYILDGASLIRRDDPKERLVDLPQRGGIFDCLQRPRVA